MTLAVAVFSVNPSDAGPLSRAVPCLQFVRRSRWLAGRCAKLAAQAVWQTLGLVFDGCPSKEVLMLLQTAPDVSSTGSN
jgi:hypothetical protein